MKKQLLTFLFVLLTGLVYAQKKNTSSKPPPPPITRDAVDENCARKQTISFSDRMKKYPFNPAASIQMVSFEAGVYLTDREILTLDKGINDSLLYSRLKEIKTLAFYQVDKLSDIIYNYGYKGTIHSENITGCYRPRNAILFLNKNGRIIEFIEICFECSRTEGSSRHASLGEMCDGKLKMVMDLFLDAGVEYGISKGILPGQ